MQKCAFQIESDAPARPRVLLSVQYLRAIAALLVVFHHARNPLPWLYNPISDYNSAAHGVSIFFVLSGFIMLTAAAGEPILEFYRRRVLRVVPLYWIATGTLCLLWLINNQWFSKTDLLKSLLFIPHYNRMEVPEIWPMLVPGWTLNFEMFFYAIFGLALFTRRVLLSTTLAILLLVAIGWIADFSSAALVTYTSPLMLEFLAGVYVAQFYRTTDFRRLKFLLPLGACLLLAGDAWPFPHFISVTIPAVMILIGALGFEAPNIQSGEGVRYHPFLKLLGDSSYAIYLFHTILIPYVGRFVRWLDLSGPHQLAAYIILFMASSILVGVVVHKLLEQPLLRWLNRLTAPARAAVRQ